MIAALDRIPVRADAMAELAAILGARLSTQAAIREQHGRGEGHLASQPPDAVAFVTSTAEVSRVVEVCSRHRLPVVPFGAGTSLEGHVLRGLGRGQHRPLAA